MIREITNINLSEDEYWVESGGPYGPEQYGYIHLPPTKSTTLYFEGKHIPSKIKRLMLVGSINLAAITVKVNDILVDFLAVIDQITVETNSITIKNESLEKYQDIYQLFATMNLGNTRQH
jgi:hypothetical protein